MMEKTEKDQSEIHLEDFPHICRICLKNEDLRSFEGEDYLLDLFRIITNIDVHSTVHFPRNICKECISRLEDISLFIEFSKCSDGMLGKNPENHEETKLYGKDVKTEKTCNKNDEESQVCRICLSQSNSMPFEGITHLMEVFQRITNIDVKPKINVEQTICKTCSDKLEEISVFISSSLSNNKKLEDALVLNRPIKIEKDMNDDGSTRFCKINYESIFDEREIKNPDIDIKQEELDYEPSASGSEFCSQDTEENPTVKDQFKCESCEKCFTRKKYLQQHLLTHIGNKPYQCNLCEKRFALKHHVEGHLLTHTGETKKPFKCNICESRFTGKVLLQRHLLIHGGEKPLKCDLCEKRFIGQSDLNRHLFIHSEQKQFKCEFCDKRFTFKLTMKRHMLNHSEEKPFRCDLCEKRFTLNYLLQRHMKRHTKKNGSMMR
ncbi:uncharacterized protein [Leptinotarsa decemlineata]|uniref:uncharacterized protein n=1 Tax=Leptinotarsa decemlineata TaxID=7539 RepID=UPI003D305E6B